MNGLNNTWTCKGRLDAVEGELGTRWHQRMQRAQADNLNQAIALVGFNCDAGVARNHGRVGAAQGADAVRAMLGSMPVHEAKQLVDVGNVLCEGDAMEAAQAQLSAVVAELLQHHAFPVVIGGGHEIAYGTFGGLAQHLSAVERPRIGIVNLDAHFDLRLNENAQGSSGTPFRQIADDCAARGWDFNYCCLGVSRFANTAALFQRADALGVTWRLDDDMGVTQLNETLNVLHEFLALVDHVYFTIDLDVLPAAVMPAVSAPAACGVALSVVEAVLDAVVASGKLRLADLAEFNPKYDVDQHGARAAARLVARLANAVARLSAI